MRVSAIQANTYRAYTSADFIKTHNNTRQMDDISFNSWRIEPENQDAEAENLKIYASINEWKNFCHKQIANGHLDVIA